MTTPISIASCLALEQPLLPPTFRIRIHGNYSSSLTCDPPLPGYCSLLTLTASHPFRLLVSLLLFLVLLRQLALQRKLQRASNGKQPMARKDRDTSQERQRQRHISTALQDPRSYIQNTHYPKIEGQRYTPLHVRTRLLVIGPKLRLDVLLFYRLQQRTIKVREPVCDQDVAVFR